MEKIVYGLFSAKWGWMLNREGKEQFKTTDRGEAEEQVTQGNLTGQDYWRLYWWIDYA